MEAILLMLDLLAMVVLVLWSARSEADAQRVRAAASRQSESPPSAPRF